MISSGRTNKSIKIFSNIICKKMAIIDLIDASLVILLKICYNQSTSIKRKHTKYKEMDQTGLKWIDLDWNVVLM